ncbi:L10-interacting MYB domain-containing protein [Cinnamomum micranthum f. kanehirae]|uniref:L10-interacting MYB domain-containing protein n=1 Tax=Cinnamomum micranthum f. kanehirae TaxID=337451 RepID=A0A443NBU4_9MAGN|nr:L10-interacting MYB domain-containing protein [Cinnamomum micranthum f. kanehirae]
MAMGGSRFKSQNRPEINPVQGRLLLRTCSTLVRSPAANNDLRTTACGVFSGNGGTAISASDLLLCHYPQSKPTNKSKLFSPITVSETKEAPTHFVLMSAPNCVGQRLKAYWTPQHHQVFMELCVEQVQKGNRPTHCFNRAGWDAIIKEFIEKTRLHYDKKQMKNHYGKHGKAS